MQPSPTLADVLVLLHDALRRADLDYVEMSVATRGIDLRANELRWRVAARLHNDRTSDTELFDLLTDRDLRVTAWDHLGAIEAARRVAYAVLDGELGLRLPEPAEIPF